MTDGNHHDTLACKDLLPDPLKEGRELWRRVRRINQKIFALTVF
jgi:hypothetical protein